MHATFYTWGWERMQVFQFLGAKFIATKINLVPFVAMGAGCPANRRKYFFSALTGGRPKSREASQSEPQAVRTICDLSASRLRPNMRLLSFQGRLPARGSMMWGFRMGWIRSLR
jgi:hypothetical protein